MPSKFLIFYMNLFIYKIWCFFNIFLYFKVNINISTLFIILFTYITTKVCTVDKYFVVKKHTNNSLLLLFICQFHCNFFLNLCQWALYIPDAFTDNIKKFFIFFLRTILLRYYFYLNSDATLFFIQHFCLIYIS